jgi:hypothetical protein
MTVGIGLEDGHYFGGGHLLADSMEIIRQAVQVDLHFSGSYHAVGSNGGLVDGLHGCILLRKLFGAFRFAHLQLLGVCDRYLALTDVYVYNQSWRKI